MPTSRTASAALSDLSDPPEMERASSADSDVSGWALDTQMSVYSEEELNQDDLSRSRSLNATERWKKNTKMVSVQVMSCISPRNIAKMLKENGSKTSRSSQFWIADPEGHGIQQGLQDSQGHGFPEHHRPSPTEACEGGWRRSVRHRYPAFTLHADLLDRLI